jgi:hypothetical protein
VSWGDRASAFGTANSATFAANAPSFVAKGIGFRVKKKKESQMSSLGFWVPNQVNGFWVHWFMINISLKP